jgi:hypothetical protein
LGSISDSANPAQCDNTPELGVFTALLSRIWRFERHLFHSSGDLRAFRTSPLNLAIFCGSSAARAEF